MEGKDVVLDERGLFSLMLVHLARQDFEAAFKAMDGMRGLPSHSEELIQKAVRQAEQKALLCRRQDILQAVSHHAFVKHFRLCYLLRQVC